MLALECQRWRDRRGSYVRASTEIDPNVLDVDVIEERIARPFVEQHHYSGSYPAARLAVGLFRRRDLVGVAVFSEGIQRAALPKWAGVDPGAGCELGRLVLLDDVAANGESWFVARALRALRREKPGMEAVLSYSDPMERRDAAGRLVKPGHVGTVYQALSACYRGRAKARTQYVTRQGVVVNERTLSKIALGERGVDYSGAQLLQLGAPARDPFEDGRTWLKRLQREGFLQTARHPGNHTYVFPLTGRVRRWTRQLEPLPYPKLFKGERA